MSVHTVWSRANPGGRLTGFYCTVVAQIHHLGQWSIFQDATTLRHIQISYCFNCSISITLNIMEFASKKNGVVVRDRLSALPDELLVHILSFLSTLDAVRTMLLRRFGNLWTQIPSLSLSDYDILVAKELLDEYEEDEDREEIDHESRGELVACFTSYVRNILMFHRRTPIEKFNLEIKVLDWLDDDSDDECRAVLDEVNMWIRYAVDREVKVLNLKFFPSRVDGSVLPRCVFTSQFLVELSISGCRIKFLSQVHLGSLENLVLCNVEVTNEIFKELISGCPSLQAVDIENQIGLDEICFTAPSISTLHLDVNPCLLDCPNVKSISMDLDYKDSPPRVVDVSSVREVNICSLFDVHQLVEVVKIFCNVQVFNFWNYIYEPPELEELVKLNFSQTRWKSLIIETELHEKEILCICKLLRSSPCIEELLLFTTIHLDDEDIMISHEFSPCEMPQLKTITLRDFKVRCQGLVCLVKFLLKNAVALEKMVIVPFKSKMAGEHEVFAKHLSSFPKASTKAKVVFGSRIY